MKNHEKTWGLEQKLGGAKKKNSGSESSKGFVWNDGLDVKPLKNERKKESFVKTLQILQNEHFHVL